MGRYKGMTPNRHDLEIWRGSSFELELVSQIKIYKFDMANMVAADQARTHAENLKYYGFVYEYINFLDIYDEARMHIRRPWVRNGNTANEALFTLSTENGRLELTETSVKIGISAEEARLMDFDQATYDLELVIYGPTTVQNRMAGTMSNDKVDKLVFGSFIVNGEKTV